MVLKRASEALVEALEKEGVEYVFGLPGGHSLDVIYDALYGSEAVKPILSRHEGGGAFAAYGYAHVTGKVGFCNGAPGPGFGQLLPGVHEAFSARLPMIALCAGVDTRYNGMGMIQEFPMAESMVPFTKWVFTVDRPEKVPWIMRRAFTFARSNPPGPVGIVFPRDLGQATAELPEYRPAPMSRSGADPKDVALAARLLLKAEKPVIVAGRGVLQAGAFEELRRLSELLFIPVLTTNGGKTAISELHPLSAGGMGVNFTSPSFRVYSECDLMLWVGSQVEEFAAGRWKPLPPGRKFIHADADPTQFARNWMPDVTLAGDAKVVLAQLIEACHEKSPRGVMERHPRVQELKRLREEYEASLRDVLASRASPVHPLQVVRAVEELMDEEAIIVLGEGANRVWTAAHLRIPRPGHWVSASEYGCMGLSVPAAIGAKLGRPECQVISLTGDGSFQMQMQELPVALQYSAPVTWVIMNNNCLGWIKYTQDRFFEGRHIAVDFEPNWRFDRVAEAAGCRGFRVEKPSELRPALAEALEANRRGTPAVVDVIVGLVSTPFFDVHHGVGTPPR